MLSRLVLVLATMVVILLCWEPILAAQQDEPALAQAGSQQDQSASSARAAEMSSSKDTRVDLSPPENDAKNHPESGAAVVDAEDAASDVQEFRAWDPHKAAKDIEVGDFYYKRKNYRAALERYKEALVYKPNDAVANFRLAECLEKTGNSQDAIAHYEEYLKILPHGPLSPDAQKALERLRANSAKRGEALLRIWEGMAFMRKTQFLRAHLQPRRYRVTSFDHQKCSSNSSKALSTSNLHGGFAEASSSCSRTQVSSWGTKIALIPARSAGLMSDLGLFPTIQVFSLTRSYFPSTLR
jgi:tetratricopeptide (TPR) repeat protein